MGSVLGDWSPMLKVAPARFYNKATKANISQLAYSALQFNIVAHFETVFQEITENFKYNVRVKMTTHCI